MRKKETLPLILTLLLLLTLTACGGTGETAEGGSDLTRGGFAGVDQYHQNHGQEKDEPSDSTYSGTPFSPFTGQNSRSASTTVMVYMVGSNLESEGGAASMDILEMMESGADVSKNNIIIYTGGSSYWALDISSDYNSIIELSPDADGDGELEGHVVDSTDRPLNMGEAGTLTEFLNYAYKEYPAQQYALICWDHGSGPIFGFGADEIYDYDSLTLEELRAALEASPFGGSNKLSWIGFDACLMSSIEYAGMLSSYADYLIASQETEPGCGWDYSFLKVLNQTTDPEQVAKAAIDSYISTVRSLRSATYDPDVTLACLDLSKMPQVSAAMDELFAQMNKDLHDGSYSRLARIRDGAKRYGMANVSGKGESLDLVDLASVADGVAVLHEKEAQALLDAVDDMVVYEAGNVKDACGVSVYYPYDNQRYYVRMGRDLYDSISASEGYRTYLTDFTEIWLGGGGMSKLELPALGSDREELTLELNEDQLAHFSSAYYTIMLAIEDESGTVTYAPVISECRIEPDENGVLHVDQDQKILVAESDGDQLIMDVTQTASDGTTDTYAAGIRLFQNATFKINISGLSEDAGISFGVDRATSEVNIKAIRTADEDLPVNGKSDISIENWHYFGYPLCSYIPVYENGTLLPYSQWEEKWRNLFYIYFEDDISFAMVPVSEVSGYGNEIVCQIVVTDTYGNRYASELKELNTTQSNLYEEDTAQGKLTYEIYTDHAVLIDYSGKDTELTLPETAQGVPVTKMKYYPFAYCDTLRHIQLPAQLETMLGNPFVGVSGLAVTIDSKNPNFSISDNLICSADGSQLYAVLKTDQKTLTVPEGVVRIEDYAVCGLSDLETVQLPSTLREIGDYAFYDCSFTELNLPEGLEKIGFGAFCYDEGDYFIYDEAGCTISKVKIPASVTWIGEYAFSGLPITEFTVGEGNGVYAASGPFLTDVTGTELLAVGGGLSGRVVIPEGILKLESSAFEGCNRYGEKGETIINELILPDSLQSIKGALPNTLAANLKLLSIGKSLTSWTGLANQAEIETILVSEENTFFAAMGHWVVKIADTDDGETAVRYVEQTENGLLSYILYSDYALLEKYEGSDTELILPDAVQGVPVTEISQFPFADGGQLTHVVLPAKLKELNFYPVEGQGSLTAEIDSSNPDFKITDDLILSGDGKRLIGALRSDRTSLTVPEGIEVIEARAVCGFTALRTVVFPSTLQKIDRAAFFRCGITSLMLPNSLREVGECAFSGNELTSLTLPEGLEKIGKYAFERSTDWDGSLRNSRNILSIPASVTKMEGGAFAGLPITGFAVADGNKALATDGTFLTDAEGKTLLAMGVGLRGSVTIPEGITAIPNDVFGGCDEITELILPDSLERMNAYLPWSLEKLVVGKNLSDWEGAEQLRSSLEVIISEENPCYTVKDGCVVKR